MSFGTSTRPGFSVRDILDLPDSTGTEETEEDDAEEASRSENAQKPEFSRRDLRERGAGRWSRGTGDLRLSGEQS